MFNLVFDLRYIVATFSMLPCLLGEVISYLGLFILQQTEVLSQPSISTIFLHKKQKNNKKRVSSTGVFL